MEALVDTDTETIICNDGVEITAPTYIVKQFITFKNLIQDITSDKSSISLPNASSQVFNLLLAYLNHFVEINNPMLNFTGFRKTKSELTEEQQQSYEIWVISKKYLSKWETEFYNEIDDNMLCNLFEAVDYLNCPFLLDSFEVEAGWRKVRGKGKPFNPLD
jgi:hypothetical protein